MHNPCATLSTAAGCAPVAPASPGFGKMGLDATSVMRENEDLQLLRALCQTEDAGARRHACEILQGHDWADGEQRVIFEACAALTRFGARINPAALAVQLTRAGFPDIDLDAMFEPLQQADAELARRLHALKGRAQ
jgi:hypothetical protein